METPTYPGILSITTTVGLRADADRLARELVRRRLAACVQVEEGLQSFYRWQGKDCEEPEVRLTIKTREALIPAVQAAFAELHPYEVPQFLAVAMQASEAYAQWVRDETQPPG